MAVQDLGIYFPQENQAIFRYHLSNIAGRASEYWSYYTSSDLFNSSQHQRRVAFFHIPFPYTREFEKQIDAVYDHADRIIILASELHPVIIQFIRRYDKSKIWLFSCGVIINPSLYNTHTYQMFDWFITTVHFYKNVRPSTLLDLKPYDVKPLMFDALLGRKKPHRDQAYDYIIDHGLDSQGVVTYINERDIGSLHNDNKKWIWEDTGLAGHENVQWTADQVKYYNYTMSLSQVIPINVYNQTAYSLVCETNFENDYVFFTEKTVKPILARRLFIMIGHRHTLATLRELGFKTFDGIIDESYDEVEAAKQRHDMAMEQLAWLCRQDQRLILDRCRDIVNHNFDLMYGRDWYHQFTGPVSRLLFD
jgi:hypothetical protein